MSAPLILKIVTPEGVDQSFDCDSVTLWMAQDSKGNGEGSIGIRKGHAEAVIALGSGPLHASLNGVPVFSGRTDGGFATVLKDVVSVVTPHMQALSES